MSARRLLLAIWLGVTETVIWLPVPVFAAAWGLEAPAFYVFLAILPLCYTAGERLTARWNRMRRMVRFALAALAGIAVGFALRPWGLGALSAAAVAAAAVLDGMSPVMPDDRRQRDLLVPALIVQFIASIAAGFIDRMEPWRPLLAAGGFITLLLMIRRVNRIALLDANLAQDGGPLPRSVLVRNRILAAAFTAVALFIAFFRQLEALWRLFIEGLNRLIERLTGGIGEPVPGELPADEGAPPMSGLPMPEESDPHWFWMLLEKIAIGIGMLVMAALAVLLLRQLLRLPALTRLIARWLAAWRERARASDTGGYVDEVERLTGESMISGVIRRLKALGRRESWAAMSPEERIRWLFRRRFQRAEKQGFRYRQSWTPRENFDALREVGGGVQDADERLRQVYTEIRYGGRPAGKEEADGLKSRLGL